MKMDVIWAGVQKSGLVMQFLISGRTHCFFPAKIGQRYRLIIGTDQDEKKATSSSVQVPDSVTSTRDEENRLSDDRFSSKKRN